MPDGRLRDRIDAQRGPQFPPALDIGRMRELRSRSTELGYANKLLRAAAHVARLPQAHNGSVVDSRVLSGGTHALG
jgi:hypothetical protein